MSDDMEHGKQTIKMKLLQQRQ